MIAPYSIGFYYCDFISRCSAARLAHHVRDVEAGGSNPLTSTRKQGNLSVAFSF